MSLLTKIVEMCIFPPVQRPLPQLVASTTSLRGFKPRGMRYAPVEDEMAGSHKHPEREGSMCSGLVGGPRDLDKGCE